MHILHVFDHSVPLHSGYTFRSLSILRAQRARGWRTSQMTGAKQGPAGADPERAEGLEFHRSAPLSPMMARLPIANQLAVVRGIERRLGALVDELKPDLLHAHSPSLNGLAALRVAARKGLPVVYEVRAFWEDAAVDLGTTTNGSARYRLTRALESHVLRRADAVTCICQGLARDIEARGGVATPVTLIPNAVDVARFTAGNGRDAELARELRLDDRPTVGFLGSFYAYEGLELLIDAMPAILAAEPRARLLLVGGGPMEAALRARVGEHGVGDSVVFTGRVPHQQVARYYSLVDVLAYPRRKMRLTDLVTPLKPLEAMARSQALAASDVGGHRELIEDGRTGRLFAADDVDALAAVVGELLGDAAQRAALGAAGRSFVERERNWEAVAARYAPIYERLVPGASMQATPAATLG